jgi:diguanylate cyclase (GGDEF)-like protein
MESILIIGHTVSNLELLSGINEQYNIIYTSPKLINSLYLYKVQPSLIILDCFDDINEDCTNTSTINNLIILLTDNELLKYIPVILISWILLDDDIIIKALNSGVTDYIPMPIHQLLLSTKVANYISLYKTVTQLAKSANIDGLTNLYNRQFFDMQFNNEFIRSTRDKKPLSFLIIDIDYFKEYNDLYGHVQGDECIKQTASIIKASVYRLYDVVVRLGGEEFGVLLPNTEEANAIIIANRVMDTFNHSKIEHCGNKQHNNILTLSIGCATYTSTSNLKTPVDVYKQADVKLYEAKNSGRNKICY